VSGRPLGLASAALPGLDPAELCAQAAAHALDGVEWGAGAGHQLPLAAAATDDAVTAIVRAAAAHGLDCCGVAIHDEDALRLPLADWQRLALVAVRLGAPHVRVYATGLEGVFRADFDRLRERLAERAAVLAAVGVRLLLEPAPSTLVPDPAQARDAFAGAEPGQVGVVYDPGSLAREGWLDPFLATGVLGGLLRHVHVKNLSPQRGADGRWSWLRTTLPAGIVDWPRVLAALDDAGYRGWLVLDHLSAPGGLGPDLADLRALTGVTSG
jgi:sugar phosphate isomerase/epimerase